MLVWVFRTLCRKSRYYESRWRLKPHWNIAIDVAACHTWFSIYNEYHSDYTHRKKLYTFLTPHVCNTSFDWTVGKGSDSITTIYLPQFLCRLRSKAAHRDHSVRRLSVCACVRACVCLSDSHTFLIVTLVNTIETKPLHISLSNFQDMLTVMRGCTLLILEVRGQRSRSHWTSMEISLWTQ